MNSVVITGCNRGIGLGLVKHIVRESPRPKHVIATCRNKSNAKELMDLSMENKNIHVVEIDVDSMSDILKLRNAVTKLVGDDGLNVLINNAGIATRFTRIGLVKLEDMIANYRTNTIAPVMITKMLLPLIKTASKNNSSLSMGIARAAVINISSSLGSIQENDKGGFYPYRCSKSALNAFTKSLSIDLKDDNIMACSVHPGWCKTDLGGYNAPLTVDEVVPVLLKTLRGLTEEMNGCFIQYDGSILPW